MDAWASPWADDVNQDEGPGHQQAISTLENSETLADDSSAAKEQPGVAGSLAFTNKLDSVDFGGASVWATEVNALGGVDSSSAWAYDSTSPAHRNNDIFPRWGQNEADVGGFIQVEESLVERGAEVGDSDATVKGGTLEDWTRDPQPDWNAVVGKQTNAETPPAVSVTTLKGVDYSISQRHPDVAVDVPTEGSTLRTDTVVEEIDVDTLSTVPMSQKKEESLVGQQDLEEVTKQKETKDVLGVTTDLSGMVVQVLEGDDDDFGDFGDAEEGEIEDVKFEPEPEPAPETTSNTMPLSPLDFTIDSSLASKLYPITQKPPPIPIIQDIISTTSARKAWYLISRDGTIGKHNSGDSDDYVRVTWSKSKVRADVCDIIDHWVKEGRFVVSDAIGGDRSYGAMFGWGDGANTTAKDSGQKGSRFSAPIGQALRGYKEGSKSNHKASISISSWDPLVSKTSIDASTVVDFGWGSSKESIRETIIKNASAPSNQQQSSPESASNPFNIVSPYAPKALEVLTLDTPGKTGLSFTNAKLVALQQLPEPPGPEVLLPKTVLAAHDNWEDFGIERMTAASNNMARLSETNQPMVSDPVGDSWASLDILEKNAITEITHPSSQVSLEIGLHNLGPSCEETTKKQIPHALELESAIDDGDDWGEMINSPATPGKTASPHPTTTITPPTVSPVKDRRPSTSHGDTKPFGTSHGGVTNANIAATRRDSAPSLITPITPSSHSIVPIPASVDTNENKTSEAIDWDFSVFERPTNKNTTQSSPRSTRPGSSEIGILAGESQVVSKDDKLVMNILDGLPDMGYMFR